jgi:hypothetical protein
MNIEFPRDLENKKRVLMIEMKVTHIVQSVMSVLIKETNLENLDLIYCVLNLKGQNG